MIRRSILAAALSLLTATAFAQTATQPPAATSPSAPPPAAAPATSKTRPEITLAKFQKRREKAIMAADTDGDGKISLLEWEALQAKRGTKGDPTQSFARADSNHDGFIDRAELDAFFAQRFARLDKNGDGVLSVDEMPGHKTAPKAEQ
ncbi:MULTISPECIES: EF-hand domain-containing protein [unclassified Mesorhizobium]|uniref:EF-hand domain-containing protein n=1 Tax=unclassified Mesorhizobium TaxID=325217 RepID=UPI00112C537E|nr:MULTISPECIES: EF-hand domain-containing protein [unclassified Mesorhizobium]MCA0000565.1 acid-shock protein [Mesorhizobium sp. B264B2A]MCA0007046.1 acid-shock protein [Mesorhizobium sp. B264B1B]MCA0016702.1 acid-shock protein [Mesorhizobium sp. B264B1A]TPJ49393.1 acid-shock protein [Mesorhizobium sp. B2-6-6]